jgi:hypothetical protein
MISVGSLSFSSARRNGFLSQIPNSRFMKQELPIAITLLAIGCLLWLWQSKEASEASAAIQHSNVPASVPTSVPQAEFKQAVNTNQLSGAQVLKQISTSLRNGAPVLGDLEIISHLFDVAQTIKGRFWNQGRGTKQTRLELILDSTNPIKLTQVCDGRFQYRLMEHRDSRQLKFHDLQRLDNEDAGIIKATLPASWIGEGSFDSLFRNLSEAFNFGEVKTATGDSELMEIVGTWNPDHLARLMAGRVDHREILPTPNWPKLPPQIPHGVRLRFRGAADAEWEPVEILFFKFDEKVANAPSPAMSIKFTQIRRQSISTDMFRFEFDETGAIDETELYNRHIDIVTGKTRVAEEASGAIR